MTVATTLARFTVTVDATDIGDFAEALGLATSTNPPPTFPIRFLFHPAARAALAAFIPADGSLPIHVGQRFRYRRPISPGETLSCALSAEPAGSGRPFALVRIEITSLSGEAVCEAESEIALAAPGFTWSASGQPR